MINCFIDITSGTECLLSAEFHVGQMRDIENIKKGITAAVSERKHYVMNNDSELIIIGADLLQESIVRISFHEKDE